MHLFLPGPNYKFQEKNLLFKLLRHCQGWARILEREEKTQAQQSMRNWKKRRIQRNLSFSTQVRHRYQKRHSLRRTFRRRRRPHGGGHDRGDSRIREHRSARRKDHPHHPNPPATPSPLAPPAGTARPTPAPSTAPPPGRRSIPHPLRPLLVEEQNLSRLHQLLPPLAKRILTLLSQLRVRDWHYKGHK